MIDNSYDKVRTYESYIGNQIAKPIISKQGLMEGLSNFKDPTFNKLVITMLFTYLYPHLMNFGFKSIGLLYLKNDSFVTFCGSASAFWNGISRYAFGHYFTAFGYSHFMKTILAITVLNAITFVWFSHYKWTYLLATCMFIMTYGGQLGTFPLVSDKLFKNKGALAYSMLLVGYDLSNVVG